MGKYSLASISKRSFVGEVVGQELADQLANGHTAIPRSGLERVQLPFGQQDGQFDDIEFGGGVSGGPIGKNRHGARFGSEAAVEERADNSLQANSVPSSTKPRNRDGR